MTRYVALLRGINVGPSTAVPMARLAEVFEREGAENVTTVLRSGNVIFDAPDGLGADAAGPFEAGILAETGVRSGVLLLDAETFVRIASANPLLSADRDGSKLFVTFLSRNPETVRVPDPADLAPEALVVGDGAVYQWMPDGSQRTAVPKSFWGQFPGTITARNQNTVDRLLTLLDPHSDVRGLG
ncbi:MAG TPA: DUF1697 domain-containing protein [Lacisediminihabitans sp.]|uniref:DUF1697 domain-containing protein n=1 Tax=Lacisediminihabitans sp. TaxID=2787631 RepID=UPI002ED8246A